MRWVLLRLVPFDPAETRHAVGSLAAHHRPGEPADSAVISHEEERSIARRRHRDVETTGFCCDVSHRCQTPAVSYLGDVQTRERSHVAVTLDVAEGGDTVDPDVGEVEFLAVVEVQRCPTPAIRPPVPNPPGVVALGRP